MMVSTRESEISSKVFFSIFREFQVHINVHVYLPIVEIEKKKVLLSGFRKIRFISCLKAALLHRSCSGRKGFIVE